MDSSSKEFEEKKKITEVKTFTVPFASEEIKKNLTINTNTSSKPFKEQIINQAFKFHSQGNISEAAKYYQYFINQGFTDPRVLSNYGDILKNLGKLKEAEISTRKAIELKPNFAEAHLNLGNILHDLGKLQEAELSYRKAIELKPDFAEAHSNLGAYLTDIGNLDDGEVSMNKANKIKSNIIKNHLNLGMNYQLQDQIKESNNSYNVVLTLAKRDSGEALQAEVHLAVNNLITGDFEEVEKRIFRFKELIKEGALEKINSKINKRHIAARSNYLKNLYPLLKNTNNCLSKKLILHIGESHCLSFANQIISISKENKKIQPAIINGGKAWHFADDQANKFKTSLEKKIKKYSNVEQVFISFGEIDCRKDEGILNHSLKYKKDISIVCKNTINGYLDYMESKLSPFSQERYYFGIPAANLSSYIPDALDLKRRALIKTYNLILKKEVLSRGCFFLDVYKLTSNDGGDNNKLYMCDNYHLSPKSLPILFKNYLFKP